MKMSEAEKREQKFSTKVFIAIGIAVLSVVIILLAYFAVNVLFSLFAAILLAVFFRGLGNWVSRYTNLPEGVSVALVCIVLLGIFSLGVFLLAPEVTEQIKALREVFPEALRTLSERISQYNWGKLILEQVPSWEAIIDKFATDGFLRQIGGLFSTTFGFAANLIVIILLAIYLASEPHIYVNGAIKLFPLQKRERMREVFAAIGETLRWWLVGKFFSMLIIGVLTTIGLGILNVPLALTLGILAALLAFIPNFGPIIAVIPAVLFALVESPVKAVYVLILYLGIQLIESYLITPMIERETVSLPPVLTIFFQIFLGVLVGGLGLILATPLLAVIIVIVKMLYIEGFLGDKNVEIIKNGDDEPEDPESDDKNLKDD